MKSHPWIDPDDYGALVQQLGDPVRSKLAFRHLVAGGADALPAVRAGLDDEDPEVRQHSVRAMDHLVDVASWPQLVSMLRDRDPRVRCHALHALACDRCKQGMERPQKSDVLPHALRILRDDQIYHARAMAVEVVALYVHEDEQARAALEHARDEDPHPMVRKKAGWNAPGGPIFGRTAPRARKGKRPR